MKNRFLLSVFLSLAAATPAAAAQGTLYGYNADLMGAYKIGLYEKTADGQATLKWKDPLVYQGDRESSIRQLSGWLRNGRLCGLMSNYPPSESYFYVERDLATGQVLVQTPVAFSAGADKNLQNWFLNAAYNPYVDCIYGYGLNAKQTGYEFKSAPASNIDNTATVKALTSPATEMCYGIAFDPATGALYGYTRADKLVRIDPVSGEQVEIGTINVPQHSNRQMDAMVWNPYTSELWLSYTDDPTSGLFTNLYAVNPKTAATTQLGTSDYEHVFSFMLFDGAQAEYSAAAPKAVENLEYTGGEMSFKVSGLTLDGNAIDGPTYCTVYVDGVERASQDCLPGDVTLSIDLTEGRHSITVIPSIGGVTGPYAGIGVQTGGLVPAMPSEVNLGEYTLTWDPVTLSDDGQQISGVSYEVTLNDVTVGQTDQTSFNLAPYIDTNADLKSYRAGVIAILDGMRSKTARSNKIVAGRPLSLPQTFAPNETSFDLCIPEDADGDNVTWQLYDGKFLTGWGDGATDDWFFLPPVNPDGAVALKAAFTAQGVDQYRQGGKLTLWACSGASSQKAVASLMEPVEIKGVVVNDINTTLLLPEELRNASQVVLALRAESPEGSNCPALISAISISAADVAQGAPAAPTNLSVVGAPEAALSAAVTFTAPTKALDGSSLQGSLTMQVASGATTSSVNCQPGETLTVDVATAQGLNNITVTPSTAAGAGLSASVSIFTGKDLPGYIRNLKASYSEANDVLYLKWDAPDRGWNGGTASTNPQDYSYLFYQYTADETGEMGYELMAQTESGVNEIELPGSGLRELQNLTVALAAVNAQGECPSLTTHIAQMGPVYKELMEDDFEGDYLEYEPMTVYSSREYSATEFKWKRPASLGEKYSDPNYTWALIWQATADNARARLDFPKFSSEGYENMALELHLWAGADAAKHHVYFQAYPEFERTEIAGIPNFNCEGGVDAYAIYTYPLAASMLSKPWVAVTLEADFAHRNDVMILGGYRFIAPSATGEIKTVFGSVIPQKGGVRICGYKGETIRIYTLDGALAASREAAELTSISLAPGAYVVRVADRSEKILVK